MTAHDDGRDPTAKEAKAALARMERLSHLGAREAAWMRQRAAAKMTHAADLSECGDQTGARYEQAEADELERDAEGILNPLMHTTAPVRIGRGGELATSERMMRPYLDTVRSRPDMLAHDASRTRMELADKAGLLTMGLDAAETIQARNSLEKMLAHEIAAAHMLAMRMIGAAEKELTAYENSRGHQAHRSIEAARSANAAARLMDAFQRGMLTLERLRTGGQQFVTVQHVNVSAGGQAVVAGTVGDHHRGDGQE